MKKKVVVLPGDGVGEEVCCEAVKVMKHVAEKYGLEIEIEEFLIGGACLDKFGIPIQDQAIEVCKKADAVLLGAVGGPKWDNNPRELRPEIALLKLRKELGLFTNLRPAKVFSALSNSSYTGSPAPSVASASSSSCRPEARKSSIFFNNFFRLWCRSFSLAITGSSLWIEYSTRASRDAVNSFAARSRHDKVLRLRTYVF